jgi:hypothetical protein
MWGRTQIKTYKKEEYIMENPEIRHKWEEFIESEQYKEYFISNEEKWSNYNYYYFD